MKRARRRLLRLVSATSLALGALGAAGAQPSVAEADAPPSAFPSSVHTATTTVTDPRAMVVVGGSEKTFVLGADAGGDPVVEVHRGRDLAPLATIEMPEGFVPIDIAADESEPDDLYDPPWSEDRYVAVLSAESVLRIDAGDLTVEEVGLGEWTDPSGPAVIDDRLYLAARSPGGATDLIRLDTSTGEIGVVVGDVPDGSLVVARQSSAVIAAVEQGSDTATTDVVVRTSTEDGPVVVRAAVPVAGVTAAFLTSDGLTLVTPTGATTLSPWTLAERSEVAPPTPNDGRVRMAGDLDRSAVVVTGPEASGGTRVRIFDPVAPTSVFDIALGGSLLPPEGRSMGFSGYWPSLYLMLEPVDPGGPATLIRIELAPTVTAVSPGTIDVDGGATVVATGARLSGGSLRVAATTVAAAPGSTDGELRATVPALGDADDEIPRAAVAASNGTREWSRQDHWVRVVQLGPFVDGPAFAEGITQDLLERPATVAEQEAIDVSLRAQGDVGRAVVSRSQLPEARRNRPAVLRLYRATLGRAPDAGGLRYWDQRIAGGMTLSEAAKGFTRSPEFRTTYGGLTNGAFVDLIYRNVLGRSPDAAGRAYWVGQIQKGVARERIALLFSESPEHRQRREPETAITVLVVGLLGRAPTALELSRWLPFDSEAVLDGIAEQILTSPAYAARH